MEIRVRPLAARDVADADRIVRVAFGTFLGLPNPREMFGDMDYLRSRFDATAYESLAAEADGRFVGSNFVGNWGSVGFFGPLSVDPPLWEKKIAQHLLEPTIEIFRRWGCSHTGLFTFSHSAKHVSLYRKFGFWPRYLTAVMAKPVTPSGAGALPETYASLDAERQSVLAGCAELTSLIYDGLDLRREIADVDHKNLGDTIIRAEGSKITSFALCHTGPGTEAGGGNCYVKFAAVRPSSEAAREFDELLAACERFTAARGLRRIIAGVNFARVEASRALLARGYRTEIQGVAMESNNEAGYNRPGVFLIDDWR